ncbi:MAG: hypothetical protein ACI835_002988 [Planctomycetota bacterium]
MFTIAVHCGLHHPSRERPLTVKPAVLNFAPYLLSALSFASPLPSPIEDEVTTRAQVLDGWIDLIGDDLARHWRQVNCAKSTFRLVEDPKDATQKMIFCTGKPTGVMRTTEVHENFVCEFEWRHMTKGWGANAGFFIWSDPMPALGVPFTRSVEVQVCNFDSNTDWYTRHGDVFPIHGSVMTTDPRYGRWARGSRSLPLEFRAKGTGEWNHYRMTCIDGTIQLELNGELVSAGYHASPRKGYICLESEGGEVHFRAMRLLPLDPDPQGLRPEDTADIAEDDWEVTPLYNGLDLQAWQATPREAWQLSDWTLVGEQAGSLRHTLPDEEWRLTIDFRYQKAAEGEGQAPPQNALPVQIVSDESTRQWEYHCRAAGQWNRLEITRIYASRRTQLLSEFNGSQTTIAQDIPGSNLAVVLSVEQCQVEFANVLLSTKRIRD